MPSQRSIDAVMQPAESKRKLMFGGTLIVAGNFAVVLWHLMLLMRVQPGFPRIGAVMLILINLLPIAGVAAFAHGARKLAAVAIVIPLATGLIIGGYSHFLSSGSDNVFRMPAGDLTLLFQISAVLLAVLELLGCWAGVRMLFRRYA